MAARHAPAQLAAAGAPGALAAPQLQPQPLRRLRHYTEAELLAKSAKELSDLLRARGQAAAGRKEVLVLRLLEYQQRMRRAMRAGAGGIGGSGIGGGGGSLR